MCIWILKINTLFAKVYVKMYIKIGTDLSNLVIIAGLFGSFLIFKNTVYNLKIIDAGQIALYQKVVRGLIVSGVVYFLLMFFALSIFSSNYIKKTANIIETNQKLDCLINISSKE